MATVKAGKIVPPKMKRGGRSVKVDEAAYEVIRNDVTDGTGEYTSDGVEYETRAEATAMLNRFKKVLVEDSETPYQVPKDLKGRVWNCTDEEDDSDKSRFVFSIADRKANQAAS